MKIVDKLLDHIAKLEHADKLEQPKDTIQRTQKFLEDYNGSLLDLYVVADALETIGSELKECKEQAYSEATLQYGESKFEHRGVSITPRESYHRYDYPEDSYIEKVEQELDTVKEQLKPLKKEEKALKNSIKDRQKKLVEEGKAEFKGSTKILAINRK